MLGPFDYVLWFGSFLLEVYVVVYLLLRRQFRSNILLGIYMAAAALETVVHYYVYRTYGLASIQYFIAYYYYDALMTLLMFFVIIAFYQQVFQEMGVNRYVRGAAAMLLAATAFFSYVVINQNKGHFTTTDRFVVEMSQNLYFVGVVLTYLLWGAILKLRETRTRLIQLVLALGIFFSADAAGYALRNLFPGSVPLESNFLRWVPPLVGTFLPLAWAYTLTKVPEEARLLTARLAPHHQT